MDIIISSSSNKPIYEQISMQIKAMVMNGELKAGDAIPPMRVMAKSLHVSVITVQHAYEDLQHEGFIETIIGKGSFIAAQDTDLIREEQFKKIDELIQEVSEIGKNNGIPLQKLQDLLNLYYEES
ncbi:MAG: GntR family transcriptional regulator [Bacteroidales bacterium]|nr:GntR family transcriptional regulator [Clostridium sp.]MCM1204859.1 GntR family transcriptional regulator [Bacteroidales bacterium]